MISNKLKWILGISVVFLLIIATNYVDRSNFRRVQESIKTIYEDRLVAQDLIYQMSQIVHQKILDLSLMDSVRHQTTGPQENAEMQKLLDRFYETRLTSRESEILSDLSANFKLLQDMEQSSGIRHPRYQSHLLEMESNINNLSAIQLDEGRRQMFAGQKAVKSIDLLTTIEVYVLVFLAILVQIIVLYNPSKE